MILTGTGFPMRCQVLEVTKTNENFFENIWNIFFSEYEQNEFSTKTILSVLEN